MKDSLLKNIHWAIILYAGWTLFTLYEEKQVLVEQNKAEIVASSKRLTKAQEDVKQVEQFNKNLEVSKGKVKEIIGQLERIQRQIPANLNDVAVQKDLELLGKKLKIVDMNTYPGKESLKDFYFAREYEVTAKGTYLQFLIFFENLENFERVLNIKELTLEEGEPGRSRFQVIKMKAIVESYKYNEKYKEKTGVNEIDG